MDSSPIASMLDAAIALHEVYLSYVQAGFSEDQAFVLIREMIARNANGG